MKKLVCLLDKEWEKFLKRETMSKYLVESLLNCLSVLLLDRKLVLMLCRQWVSLLEILKKNLLV